MDPRRAAELHDPNRKTGGTGYLIQEGLILTAHHVIALPGQSGIINTPYHVRLLGDYDKGKTDWRIEGCYLCWDDRDNDLALLKLKEDKLEFLSAENISTRFGKLGYKTLPAEGTGFPAVQMIGTRQNPEPIKGELSRIAGLKEKQLRLQVTSLIPDSPLQWQGIQYLDMFFSQSIAT